MQECASALVMDLGGTGARALFVDGTHRAVARGPAANPNRVGADAATQRVLGLLKELNVGGRLIPRGVIGMAGVSHPASQSIVRRAMAEALVTVTQRWLCNDAELAHRAAFRANGGVGVLVVAGTGSIAVARSANATFVRAGGLGPVLGDEGSGHWIGAELLRLASSDAALQELLRLQGVTARQMEEAQKAPSILAGYIDALSGEHESVRQVALAAGKHLANLAYEAFHRAGVPSHGVKVSGSVLAHSRRVRSAFTTALGSFAPPLNDLGTLDDVLEEGMHWILHVDEEPVPPGW